MACPRLSFLWQVAQLGWRRAPGGGLWWWLPRYHFTESLVDLIDIYMFQARRMRCWRAPACCEASRSRPVFEASFGELLDLLGLVWRSVERSRFCSGVGFLCENKWVPSTYVFVDLKTFVNLGRSFPNECIFGFCAVLSLFSWRYVGRQQASDWLWGFRIPIRELKVHYFRLDSVLGCICLFKTYIGSCLVCRCRCPVQCGVVCVSRSPHGCAGHRGFWHQFKSPSLRPTPAAPGHLCYWPLGTP